MIAAYDLSGLRDLWNHYDISLFERMEHHFMPGTRSIYPHTTDQLILTLYGSHKKNGKLNPSHVPD